MSMVATVEESLALDVGTVTDIASEQGGAGELTWTRESDGVDIATVGFRYRPSDDAFQFSYTVDGERDVVLEVELTYTPANLGGERPWFRCPDCGSRRAKLHKPPDHDHFRCRDCHDLLYESQTHTPSTATSFLDPFDRMDEARERVRSEGPSREALREFYEAKKEVFETVNERCREYGHPDMELEEWPFPETFEAWYQQLLAELYGPTFGEHGRCEATAKSTDHQCWQSATGEHGKCYYHGGADGAGAPEGNQNAASGTD
jgi:hypothetical protein